jgi:hypothetical protein
MGTIIGVVIGYVLGTRAGEKGYEELKGAWETISSSEEVREILAGAFSLVGVVLREGRGRLAERLQVADEPGLTRVA